MRAPLPFCLARRHLLMAALAALCLTATAQSQAPVQGVRVFSAGHSFHVFVPPILAAICKDAKLTDHKQVGVQSIGGSQVIQHWNLPEAKNTVKPALQTGKIDVLTLSPIYLPDAGIENLAKLGLEHNPNIRVTVEEFWLPFDTYEKNQAKMKGRKVDRTKTDLPELRKMHEAYFEAMDEHVTELNKKFGKQVVFVVPAGQAVMALRENIAEGKAPGLKADGDLFTDDIGHAKAPLQALVAYSHYAVIYRQSPVGLPVLPMLKTFDPDGALTKLLQELAWDAAVKHPLSGVKATK